MPKKKRKSKYVKPRRNIGWASWQLAFGISIVAVGVVLIVVLQHKLIGNLVAGFGIVIAVEAVNRIWGKPGVVLLVRVTAWSLLVVAVLVLLGGIADFIWGTWDEIEGPPMPGAALVCISPLVFGVAGGMFLYLRHLQNRPD